MPRSDRRRSSCSRPIINYFYDPNGRKSAILVDHVERDARMTPTWLWTRQIETVSFLPCPMSVCVLEIFTLPDES